MLKPLVIGPDGAVDKRKRETLQGHHRIVHEDCLQGSLPLLFAGGDLIEVRLVAGQRGDGENQVKLRQLVIVLDLLRVGDKFLVYAKESGLVEHGEQRRPLLEVDVHASVGKQPRRYPHCLRGRFCGERVAPLNMQEGLGVELGARLAILLHLTLEGFWKRRVSRSRQNVISDGANGPMNARPLEAPMK